jgi:hypothetical protein
MNIISKTKIMKERFMKRKTVLKLVTFILFGMCLLSSRKAEATLMLEQSSLVQKALKSNQAMRDELTHMARGSIGIDRWANRTLGIDLLHKYLV